VVFSGSEKNILNRYYLAAKKFKSDIIVRITGDCPLVDSE
jgi:spore coat polysaccharide biosynthesis protein SpsF (cytidylyltransferase family)